MFTTLIVQPIFNLLVLIYALLPGHNFGLAIIIFTVVIRMLMWPLVKKQLHNAKAMRALQPDLKRIKKAAAGDRQKESMLVMELYKERGVNPFSSLGIIILQLPILLGLYSGLRRIIDDPQNLVSFAYPWVQNLSWLKELAGDISKFDHNLFGIVDLSRSAWGNGPTYWPAMVLVLASALSQYYQSKQLMPDDKDARKVRDIMKGAGQGQTPDSGEMNAAVSRNMRYFIPVMIFFFTVNLASALSLYWLVSGIVAIIQQRIVFNKDEEEMTGGTSGPSRLKVTTSVLEGEVISPPKKSKPTPKKSQASKKGKKRKR